MLRGTSKRVARWSQIVWTVLCKRLSIGKRVRLDCLDWSSIEENNIEKEKHWIQNKSFRRWVLRRVSARPREEDSSPDLPTRDHNIVCLAMPAHPKRIEMKSRRISKWRVKGRVVVHNVEKQLKWTVISVPRESQARELISVLQLSPLCQSWKNEWEVRNGMGMAGNERTCTWSKECDRPLTLKVGSKDRERKQNHFANWCNQKTVDLRTSKKRLILCNRWSFVQFF